MPISTSFGPHFRIHLGLSLANETFATTTLNGPDSHSYVCEGKFELSFDESAESIDACAEEMARFVQDVAEPWFAAWRDVERLINDVGSPLGADQKARLRNTLESGLPESN